MSRSALPLFFYGIAATLSAAPAMAQSDYSSLAQNSNVPSQQGTSFSVGLGAGGVSSPYRSYDDNVHPLPLVNYDNGSFYFRGLGAGYRLVSDQHSELAVTLGLGPNYFSPNKTNDPQLAQLSARKFSVMAGLAYSYQADWGKLSASAATDVTGNSHGQIIDLQYGYPLRAGRLVIVPSVGTQWDSANYNNYYYGVDLKQAARSGLSYYNATGGWNPFFNVTALYPISSRWNLLVQARYTHLSDTIQDSPMVDSSRMISYVIGASYRF